MDRRLPRALFALTGDHWSRRFLLNRAPTFWERSAVPLPLYGPSVLGRVRPPESPVGGHLDIAPTLIELAAPAGFAYHSLGENLLAPKRRLGLGLERIVGPDFIAEIGKE
jgi:phosphoglycerol transferase MdoB-like AlkP superfamily enzyme